ILGVRPAQIRLRAAPSKIVVDISENLGGVAYDYLTTPTNERIIVETRGDKVLAVGTSVAVEFDPEAAMFFDQSTEARLR
ncbi:MAG: TOBE domain-containing protein, partial [Albidovulum sp.]